MVLTAAETKRWHSVRFWLMVCTVATDVMTLLPPLLKTNFSGRWTTLVDDQEVVDILAILLLPILTIILLFELSGVLWQALGVAWSAVADPFPPLSLRCF
jgi:hypothetical protein